MQEIISKAQAEHKALSQTQPNFCAPFLKNPLSEKVVNTVNNLKN